MVRANSLSGVPRRLDFVRFRVGDDEIEVAFVVALELAERAVRTKSPFSSATSYSKMQAAETSVYAHCTRIGSYVVDEFWPLVTEHAAKLLERVSGCATRPRCCAQWFRR